MTTDSLVAIGMPFVIAAFVLSGSVVGAVAAALVLLVAVVRLLRARR